MKGATDFARAVTGFFTKYLPHDRNVSENTRMAYRDTMAMFIVYMRDRKGVPVEALTLSHLTKENVRGFLEWVMVDLGRKAVTRNLRLAAMHSFVRYLQYSDIERMAEWQDILSIRFARTGTESMNHITPEGVRLLLEQPDTGTRTGRRHLACLALMYEAAARVQEVADLTVESLRISSRPYTMRIVGKGNKARIVPLSDDITGILRDYLEENGLTEPRFLQSPLFPNRNGGKVTRFGITYILDKYATMAHKLDPSLVPERFSPHCLRHSRAMALLQAGVNIVDLRDLLGHVSIQTTNIYARADSKAKREALERAYERVSPQTERIWEKDPNLLDWLRNNFNPKPR